MTGTVVFQHGLGGGADQVAQYWPEGTGLGRVTYPCAGHDGAALGMRRPFSIPQFAEDVLKSCGDTAQFTAAGTSMGAAIALYLACHHPDRVRSLILIRPAWAFSAAPANLHPIAEMAGLLARLPPPDAAEAFRAGATGQRMAQHSPDNLASILGYADRPDAAAFAEVLRDIAAGHPGVSGAEVAALRLQCLIVGTDDDIIHPLFCAEALARSIPKARLLKVTPKSAGRDVHHAEVRAAVAAFLSEHIWS